jgi:hypothetical protein
LGNSSPSTAIIQARQLSNQASNQHTCFQFPEAFRYNFLSPPNMQFTSVITFLISFALFFQGIEALARSKLDQYTSETW